MQNSPLVTVLMPCYNAQDYLAEALESIMQQSYQNLDILCINDGS
ncbi:MAG: glycosyltransferase family 2 protein, partial [Bacteroidales bacterium]